MRSTNNLSVEETDNLSEAFRSQIPTIEKADFAELEKELGYALPEDFKELYRIADGEAGGKRPESGRHPDRKSESAKRTAMDGTACSTPVASV